MLAKRLLLVALLVVAAVFLVSCISGEDRAEVLTQQNCMRGCIDRCPQEMARYNDCATRCGQICKAAGEQQQPQRR
jgi:hypothetical protein